MEHEPNNKETTNGVIETTSLSEQKNNLSIPLAIVFAGILVAGAIIYTDKSNNTDFAQQGVGYNQQAAPAEEPALAIPDSVLNIKSDDHVVGNPDAEIIVFEYSDAQCPFCQRFHESMASIMSTYTTNGGIAWVYRHFPLDSIHPYARKGAEALECAAEQGGNVAFAKFEDVIFSPSTTSIAPDNLPALASTAGLDVAKFSTCLNSGKFAPRVERDFQEGASIGIRGTPYSIAWNKRTNMKQIINGAQPPAVIGSIIESLGAKK